MDGVEYLKFFINTDTPFMLLFVALFFYNIKTNKDRENRLHDLIEKKLGDMENELNVLVEVWKILLEKELEVRK